MKTIHKYSELNRYIGRLSPEEITDELIDCFEAFRKEEECLNRSKKRNEANISVDNAEYKGLIFKPYMSVADVAIKLENKEKIQ